MNDAANWLMERRKCTLETAFIGIREFVRCYVDASNDMLSDQERKYPYSLEDGDGPRRMFVASGFPYGTEREEDRVTVKFVLNESDITVSYLSQNRNPPDLVVTQKWDARRATCVLRMNDEEWTNEQVSQMAVDPLFFV